MVARVMTLEMVTTVRIDKSAAKIFFFLLLCCCCVEDRLLFRD
jgi:hypothetical protein